MSFFDRLTEGLKDIGTSIADFTPKLIGALVILLVGWWISKIIRGFIRKILERKPMSDVLDKSGVTPALAGAGYSAPSLVANVIYAIALLITFLLASEALGSNTLTDLIRDLIAYLPLVVAAILVLVLTAWVGTFVADLARPWAETKDSGWIADAARYAILVFGVLTALNVLGIGTISTQVFQFALGAVAVAFAISFGVGGIETARLWWQRKLSPRDGS